MEAEEEAEEEVSGQSCVLLIAFNGCIPYVCEVF